MFQPQVQMQMQMQPPNENRQQKRHSVEKRMSLEAKRSSIDKRASLEIKLHDGMIVVDEEERNRLQRKNTVTGVINHPQVQNHFQSPPRSVSSPTGGFMPVGFPQQPQQQQFDPRMMRPPTQQPMQPMQPGNQFQRPMDMGPPQGMQNVSPQFHQMGPGMINPPVPGMPFQGPPRQGSLTSPSQPQFQRPPPPQQIGTSQQPQFPTPSMMMNMPPPSPSQSFPGSNQFQPMMQGSRPMYSGSIPPPLQNQSLQQQQTGPQPLGVPGQGLPNIGRHSPMILDALQSQTWANGPDSNKPPPPNTYAPVAAPPPINNSTPLIPASSVGPTPPASLKHPATIQEEDSQFTPVNENDEYYDDDDDNESAGSFLSFDEETEDNTEYNAIVDYDLLDMIMGGSTDYDAPMPRATHERRVIFNQVVKAQSLVRVLKEGEIVSPAGAGGDPDGDTEFEETESEVEDEDDLEYVDESEEEEYDESPPSPVMEVLNVLPLRPADLEGAQEPTPPPEITPRGVSLKMNPDGTVAQESSPQKIPAALAAVPPPQSKSAPQLDPASAVMAAAIPAAATATATAPIVTTASTATGTSSTEPSPTSVSGDAPSRKKVRHVQIQTRGATMKTQQTMTDLTMASSAAEITANLNEFPSGAETAKAAAVSDDSPEPPPVVAEDPRVKDLEAEKEFLQMQNTGLLELVARLEAEAAARQAEMEESHVKFDRLSGQAMKKIKELVAERKVLEVEMEGLRGQVSGLEGLLGKWTAE
ncbi:hypothetical protein BDR26DRAFT_858837 [Obelidium mucronatum]|nr:hypothetical protein BDR26DRAFT_858837 [Obelidium mucronatum]